MHIKNRKPEFCFIAPTNYLDFVIKYGQSESHLILAHLVDHDEKYCSFYRDVVRERQSDPLVIMDNGAFELGESYNPDKLITLAHKVKADVIVLPDFPNQPIDKTIEYSERYVNDFKQEGFKTMFVPQSPKGDFDQWKQGYIYAKTNPLIDMIGMSILGIPNAVPSIDKSYARVVVTAILQHSGLFAYNKHHHYLGLNSGPKLEIPSLIKLNALDTIDSSGPIWAGITGHSYNKFSDSFMGERKVDLPVDFSIPYTPKVTDLIIHNIKLTQSLFN
jgi:hypothetical protein